VTGSKLPPKRAAVTEKAEFDWTRAEYPRISPGVYSVVGRAWQGPSKLAAFGRWSIRIEFTLLDDGSPVSLFLNLGRKEQPHFGIASNYYQWWTAANGGPPERGEAMKPDIFLQEQVFEVMVEDSHLNAKKEAKSEHQIYSHVTKLIGVSIPGDPKKSGKKRGPK